MTYQHPTITDTPPSGDATIPTTRLAFNPRSGKHGESTRAARFIRGPISFNWMQKANDLPGKAGAVGLALWFLKGVKRSSTFAVTAEAETLAKCSRQAFARSLAALAAAGLISVQPKKGARPTITIRDSPPTQPLTTSENGHETAVPLPCRPNIGTEYARTSIRNRTRKPINV